MNTLGASLTIVLPDFVGSGELSDAELEEVAGGKGCSGKSWCVGASTSAFSQFSRRGGGKHLRT